MKIWQNVNDTSINTTKKEELKSAERERHTVKSPKSFWSRWYYLIYNTKYLHYILSNFHEKFKEKN